MTAFFPEVPKIRYEGPASTNPLSFRHYNPDEVVEGRTMKEAAAILNVATRTVAFHKYRIMEEFGMKTNSDLVRFAIREHIVTEP